MAINQEIFNQNLLLTQAYCEMQFANNNKAASEILRSINPEYEGKPIFSFGVEQHEKFTWNSTSWTVDPFDDKLNFYQYLFDEQIASKRSNVVDLERHSITAGRILVVAIDETFLDGASESGSDGFIDDHDCPPIDTWFYMEQTQFTRMLYAWIPQQFVELVNLGIKVNALDVLNWQDNPHYYHVSKSLKVAYEEGAFRSQYEPHQKYNPDRRYIAPIVAGVLLFFILLVWFAFHNN